MSGGLRLDPVQDGLRVFDELVVHPGLVSFDACRESLQTTGGDAKSGACVVLRGIRWHG
jgi:hypothetical protein